MSTWRIKDFQRLGNLLHRKTSRLDYVESILFIQQLDEHANIFCILGGVKTKKRGKLIISSFRPA